jgi:hypothetical protein
MKKIPWSQRLLHSLDPELAHLAAVSALKFGLAPMPAPFDDPVLATRVWGLEFANPIGLAAGFDKGAEVIDPMLRVGFGFVEAGSVTPLPQPGSMVQSAAQPSPSTLLPKPRPMSKPRSPRMALPGRVMPPLRRSMVSPSAESESGCDRPPWPRPKRKPRFLLPSLVPNRKSTMVVAPVPLPYWPGFGMRPRPPVWPSSWSMVEVCCSSCCGHHGSMVALER